MRCERWLGWTVKTLILGEGQALCETAYTVMYFILIVVLCVIMPLVGMENLDSERLQDILP